MRESFRQDRCALCREVFYICRYCDRGQIYCSPPCRRLGRTASRRRANRRHQQTPEGRKDHRDRQRRWREKNRNKENSGLLPKAPAETPQKKVTDMGRLDSSPCGTTSAATPSQKSDSAAIDGVEESSHAEPTPPLVGQTASCAPVAGAVHSFLTPSHFFAAGGGGETIGRRNDAGE